MNNEIYKTKKEIIEDLDKSIELFERYVMGFDLQPDEIDEAVEIYGRNILNVVEHIRHASIELHLVIDYLKGAKRELQVGMPKET